MLSKKMTMISGLLAVWLVAPMLIHAGDETKVKGLITGRTGETIVVKTNDGNLVTAVLAEDTKVQHPKGLGIRKQQMSSTVLIPGLKVTVKGVSQDATHILARSITFDKYDLGTAEMIQAGLNPTEQRVSANTTNIALNRQDIEVNKQNITATREATETNRQNIAANRVAIDTNAVETSKRFAELSEYDTKDQLTVRFSSGSSTLSASDKDALKKLAQDANGLTGYIIQVKGFADSQGAASMNTKLSMARAQNVITYLIQYCSVPVRHIIAPGAMGETAPAASNESREGRAENRRAEVAVLVNKGIGGR